MNPSTDPFPFRALHLLYELVTAHRLAYAAPIAATILIVLMVLPKKNEARESSETLEAVTLDYQGAASNAPETVVGPVIRVHREIERIESTLQIERRPVDSLRYATSVSTRSGKRIEFEETSVPCPFSPEVDAIHLSVTRKVFSEGPGHLPYMRANVCRYTLSTCLRLNQTILLRSSRISERSMLLSKRSGDGTCT